MIKTKGRERKAGTGRPGDNGERGHRAGSPFSRHGLSPGRLRLRSFPRPRSAVQTGNEDVILARGAGSDRAERPMAQLVTGCAWPGLPVPCLRTSLHITSSPTPLAAASLLTLACVVLMTTVHYDRGRARPAWREEL